MISNNQSQTQSGFTIVELLIVIVVIAILAAITVVAYNGIQQSAENTKTVNGVGQYVRIIHSYAAQNGSYPITNYSCLGPTGTICANTTDSTGACFGAGGAQTQGTFETAIKTVVNAMPELSKQTMNCGGKMYGGAWYHSTDGKSSQLVYYLRGNQSCTAVGGLILDIRQQADDATVCYMRFPQI